MHGPNVLPAPTPVPFWRLVLKQFSDTLVLILLGAAIVSFVLAIFEESEHRTTAFVEPIVILLILIANATVGVIQETSAASAIDVCCVIFGVRVSFSKNIFSQQKLKEFEARTARVLRRGSLIEVETAVLVPGDIVEVAAGDQVFFFKLVRQTIG